jgi:predicted amidohydrolase
MRIAAAQVDVAIGQVDDNVRKVVDWISRAREAAVDLVVFPECMLSGYCFDSREEAMQQARPIDDPLWDTLAKACAGTANDPPTKSLYAVVGFLERAGDQLFNASDLVGPNGVVGSYRKIHLPHLGVDRFVDRGDRPYAVFQAGELRVGLAICYDCSFPEPMRVLALQGADVIALATNWPVAARRTAVVVPPARSMENHLYFVAANRIGRERTFEFCGLSSIAGPDGIDLGTAPENEETLLMTTIHVATARNKRIQRTADLHVIDRFADRRPEFYQKIIEPID